MVQSIRVVNDPGGASSNPTCDVGLISGGAVKSSHVGQGALTSKDAAHPAIPELHPRIARIAADPDFDHDARGIL